MGDGRLAVQAVGENSGELLLNFRPFEYDFRNHYGEFWALPEIVHAELNTNRNGLGHDV